MTATTRLYQVGTFAAGNRLLDPGRPVRAGHPDRPNAITSATAPAAAAARRSARGSSSTPRCAPRTASWSR